MYTSKELSKKLKEGGCELESKITIDDNGYIHGPTSGYRGGDTSVKRYPAYDILNDICVKYAKEFFGEWNNQCDKTTHILLLMRSDREQKEAEDYIWEHCLFNPKNK